MQKLLVLRIMVDLSIIIVSWNCWEYIDQCLQSLEHSESKCSYTVVVVDNDSDDGTPLRVKERYPYVDVITNDQNVGFATANNQALRVVRSRYILLLNPDTVVRKGALDALIQFMDDRENIWAAGPAMVNADGTPQRTGVRFPTNWNILVEALFLDRLYPQLRLFGRHKELFEDPERPRAVDYVQGACLMVRFKAIETIGGLDEHFFMYFEETDWCYRIKAAGGEVYYCPSATVVHFGGGETGHYDEVRLLHYHRSLLLFYHKHYSTLRSVGMRTVLAFRAVLRTVVWSVVAATKPAMRRSAVSSARGYIKTLGMLLQPVKLP